MPDATLTKPWTREEIRGTYTPIANLEQDMKVNDWGDAIFKREVQKVLNVAKRGRAAAERELTLRERIAANIQAYEVVVKVREQAGWEHEAACARTALVALLALLNPEVNDAQDK